MVVYHSWLLATIKILGMSQYLLLLRGLKVMNQVIPIYLVSLTFIGMFLFDPFSILTC